jgi:pimeloyl-ACP methyl ester carboxylesterase
MAQKHWILTANASVARLFERTSLLEPLIELADWMHPEGSMLASELENAPLGHSMGGKAAMQLALTQGALVRRLVVADIAPVAYSHDQTRHIQAMRGLDLTDLHSRAEADQRLSAVVEDAGLRAFFLQSLELKADNGPRWRLNFDVLEAEMPKIVGWPGTAGSFDGPTLFLTGAESHYVRPEHREPIRAQFPKARFAKLIGAGHWLHAEKPREFEEAVRVFLTA